MGVRIGRDCLRGAAVTGSIKQMHLHLLYLLWWSPTRPSPRWFVPEHSSQQHHHTYTSRGLLVQAVRTFVARTYRSGSRQQSYPSFPTTPNSHQLLATSDYWAFLTLRPTIPQQSELIEISDITSLLGSEPAPIFIPSSIYQA
jgi:hypothetical protein